MSVLGIRCSNKDFTYAIMTGTKKNPSVLHIASVTVPKNFTRPRALPWMVQEIQDLIEKHAVANVVMKASEGRFRGKPYTERVELEAAVYIAAGMNGMNAVFKKVKSTIAKDLGLKGRGHYLQTTLDTSVIVDFDAYSEKEKEAILAGWSEL